MKKPRITSMSSCFILLKKHKLYEFVIKKLNLCIMKIGVCLLKLNPFSFVTSF